MTESEMFCKFGCGCRALLKLCELKGVGITKEELIERFRPHFGDRWKTQLGITFTSDLIYMAQDLKICNFADTHVSIDYIRDVFERGSTNGIFLIVDKWLNEKHEILEPYYHTALLLHIDQTRALVHLGVEDKKLELSLDLLPVLQSHFLVLG